MELGCRLVAGTRTAMGRAHNRASRLTGTFGI